MMMMMTTMTTSFINSVWGEADFCGFLWYFFVLVGIMLDFFVISLLLTTNFKRLNGLLIISYGQ